MSTTPTQKTRVHLLAKELNVSSKDILDKCRAEGLDIKNHMTLLTAGQIATIREWFSDSHGSTAAETAAPVPEKVLERARKKAAHRSSDGEVDGSGSGVMTAIGEASSDSLVPLPVGAEAGVAAAAVAEPTEPTTTAEPTAPSAAPSPIETLAAASASVEPTVAEPTPVPVAAPVPAAAPGPVPAAAAEAPVFAEPPRTPSSPTPSAPAATAAPVVVSRDAPTKATAPIAGAPVAGAPVAGAPVAGAPVAGAPVAGAPIAPAPVAPVPLAPTPIVQAAIAPALIAPALIAPALIAPAASPEPVPSATRLAPAAVAGGHSAIAVSPSASSATAPSAAAAPAATTLAAVPPAAVPPAPAPVTATIPTAPTPVAASVGRPAPSAVPSATRPVGVATKPVNPISDRLPEKATAPVAAVTGAGPAAKPPLGKPAMPAPAAARPVGSTPGATPAKAVAPVAPAARPGSGSPHAGLSAPAGGSGSAGGKLPGTTLPGSASAARPGTTLPGTTLPGTTLPGTTLPGTTLPGTTLPGTTLPGTTLPGTTLPGKGPAPAPSRPGSPGGAPGGASAVGPGGRPLTSGASGRPAPSPVGPRPGSAPSASAAGANAALRPAITGSAAVGRIELPSSGRLSPDKRRPPAPGGAPAAGAPGASTGGTAIQLQAASVVGPNVQGFTQPDPDTRRPRPAARAESFTGESEEDRGAADRGKSRFGGAGTGAGAGAKARRPPTNSGRREGRGSQDVQQKIREWSEADLLEREERINKAGALALNPLTGKPVAKHIPQRAVSAVQQARRSTSTTTAEIEEPISVKSLSAATGIRSGDILKKMLQQGAILTINSSLTTEQAEILCADYNIELKIKRALTAFDKLMQEFRARDKGELVPRAPVVTILGHVDHGKTSLLDAIRSANVAAGEAGGITQHIAAWKVVTTGGKPIVFIDTPGHQAFTAMRARGANMTDIAVLVVSPADGGVMATTIEAIDHAKAANVPIVVALTKTDRPEVDENQIRQVYGQLAERGLTPRDWGGETEVVRTSATKRIGIDELLEMLAFTAETLDLKADPDSPASGRVIETRVDPERGKLATLLVQDGTMVVGDIMLAGSGCGRVRAIYDDHGRQLDDAGPATPVNIIGIEELPEAGEFFFVTDDLDLAKEAAEERQQIERQKQLARLSGQAIRRNWAERLTEGKVQELNIILRADVQGSIDALLDSIAKLGSKEVAVKVIRYAVGGISEADVELARASNAVIVGFHVIPEDNARRTAEQFGVEIRLYQVIYEILDDITRVLEGKLIPEKREEVLGHLEVRQVFKSSKVGMIAGCFCTDGKVARNSKIRITRNNVVIANDRELESLKRFKDDVREVAAGMECGLRVAGYDDIKDGDKLEAYVVLEIARKL